MASILIVEDTDLAFGLKINLELGGFSPTIAETGAEALRAVGDQRVDLVLLDLMLPDVSGFDVLRRLKAVALPPCVIVVSARTGELDRVAAFKLGADDYVIKPFFLLELIERIKVRLLRPERPHGTAPELFIDIGRRRATYNNMFIPLTPLELDLLAALVRADGAVVSKPELLRQVWHAPPGLRTRTVDYHVGSLRKKLANVGAADCLRIVRKSGVAWTGSCASRFL